MRAGTTAARTGLRGVLAGAAGALALYAFERFETRRLGRPPIYAASVIARRWSLPPAAGAAMRAAYASALGVLLVACRHRLPRRSLAAGLELGSAIAAAELVLLPLVDAVPPVSRWSAIERRLLFAHAGSFALVATAIADRVNAWT